MPDAEFERTFSDLAHARLRDRAPGLLDHLVGFQLLDKSEDNTHAVGVWGFDVGGELMYAPVFFLNGQLKGDDLLYLKSQDAFVPLQENWINYLLNRRPYILGETEEMTPAEMGIQQPDFNAMARPPYTGSKYASANTIRGLTDYLSATIADDFKPFLPVIMSPPGGEKRASLKDKWDVPNFIKDAGWSAARVLLATMRKNASFADSLLSVYKMEDILEGAKAAFMAAGTEKKAAEGDVMIEDTAPTVQVMVADRANVLDLDDAVLTDEEKERLQRDRYAVRDNRSDDETSTVYETKISKTLQNPHCSSYCRVLMADGEFQTRLVMLDPVGCECMYSEDRGDVTVIDVQNGRMISTNKGNVFVDNEGHKFDEWRQTFNNLPGPGSVSERQKVIFVNEKGDGTAPFFVERRVVADGRTTLYGEFDNWPRARNRDTKMNQLLYPPYRGQTFNVSDAKYSRFGGSDPISIGGRYDKCIVITNKPGNNITQIGSDYFVPDGFKVVKLSKDMIEPWKLDRPSDSYARNEERRRKAETDRMATPQSLAEIELNLFKSANVREIQAVTDGIEWWIRDSGNIGRPMSKIAALKKLIINYGLREGDANGILKTARRSGSPKYFIKSAQPFAPAMQEPLTSTDPTLFTNPRVMYPQDDLVSANNTPLDRYGATTMDMDATFRAEQAAQQGQKEVLDTSVISGLVKSMDPNTVVDQYLGDLMLGLDRIGRIKFMYYWHFDKFKDRYGSQDMPELEDNLNNVFENLGDLTLFLKQKTIEPDVSDATAEAELEQIL
jgi:hypothetical protein